MVEKKQINVDLDHIRRASSCLIEASTLIRSCSNPQNLLQDLCGILVQWGYPLTIAVQVQDDCLTTRALAGAGYCDVHLPLAGSHWDELQLIKNVRQTLCPATGRCIHRPMPTFTDLDLCELPLSVLAIPLSSGRKSPVILLIYEQTGENFTEDDVDILAEIGHLVPRTLLDFILS